MCDLFGAGWWAPKRLKRKNNQEQIMDRYWAQDIRKLIELDKQRREKLVQHFERQEINHQLFEDLYLSFPLFSASQASLTLMSHTQ